MNNMENMQAVDQATFRKHINDHKAVGPEVEHLDDCTVEDWWDEEHDCVIACTHYYNGQTVFSIRNPPAKD